VNYYKSPLRDDPIQSAHLNLGRRKAISIFLPIFIVATIIIIIAAAAYFAIMLPGSLPTQTQTPTTFPSLATQSVSYSTLSDQNLTYSLIFIVNGASLGKEVAFSPWNATVVIGQNNTVHWVNLDTVNQTITGSSNLFNATIAPQASWNFTFTNPGNYSYTSPAYPWENGSVTVIS
jgi:plastocyanin